MVPLAIATKAEASVETVAAIIRESGYVIPSRLTTSVGEHPSASIAERRSRSSVQAEGVAI